MEIVVNIVAKIEAQHYPLDVLNELLYALIDELAGKQSEYKENVPLPITSIKKLRDSADAGKLTCNIAESN